VAVNSQPVRATAATSSKAQVPDFPNRGILIRDQLSVVTPRTMTLEQGTSQSRQARQMTLTAGLLECSRVGSAGGGCSQLNGRIAAAEHEVGDRADRLDR
jgi:hypothetical protein